MSGDPGHVAHHNGLATALTDTRNALDTVEATSPGREIDYMERATPFTTTNTSATSLASTSIIDSLSVTIVGEDRPVAIELQCLAFHSVANTPVGLYLLRNGTLTNWIWAVASPSTTSGVTLLGRRRIVVPSGQVYTYTVGVYGTTAGTSTISAASNIPICLSATAC